MKKTMKLFRILLIFFIAASTWPCHALDHSPRWIGNTVKYGPENSLNGLVDLDNFPVGSYGYCKWGVLQDENDNNTVTLHFTQLTAGPFANSTKECFFHAAPTSCNGFNFPPMRNGTLPMSRIRVGMSTSLNSQVSASILAQASTSLCFAICNLRPFFSRLIPTAMSRFSRHCVLPPKNSSC